MFLYRETQLNKIYLNLNLRFFLDIFWIVSTSRFPILTCTLQGKDQDCATVYIMEGGVYRV